MMSHNRVPHASRKAAARSVPNTFVENLLLNQPQRVLQELFIKEDD